MSLEGKKVVITGGTSGIGRCMLSQFLMSKAEVVFCGQEKDLVNEINKTTLAKGITVDLTLQNDIDTFCQFVDEQLESVDILINNAGYVIVAPLEELSRQDFEKMYAINVIAPAMITKYFLPQFRSRKEGDIINIGATGGGYGFPQGAAYASSKAALANFSQTLIKEVRKEGIRVFHVDPSWTTGTNNNNKGGKIPLDEEQLTAEDVASAVINQLLLPRRSFIPNMSIWATNP
ncbi:SDR family oxidoreductase [Flammeovirga agarivorans]|uniref:SDR family NAD(P)-dependent oxidoreductase n=1 Tax=Flammeovirga agarivorans TaxID=2726742 RepID=A0A7X8XUS0_9BACT|nr:SDR family NAD(P)-dependent oxidoreductase [Flammeovirga agarivorans]NLR90380.1 SDR family NAD(P)-dependent oxidoreductase [Flammeovirga agarivorans]